MLRSLLLALLFLSIGRPPAPESHWEHTTLKDPLTDRSIERLALTGEYLLMPTTPSLSSVLGTNLPIILTTNSVSDTPPKLVLLCSNKKLIKQYGVLAGTPLATPPPAPISGNVIRSVETKLDYVVDGSRKRTVSADVIRTVDRALTDDTSQRQYLAFDLGNVLADILRGKSITLVARDNFSANMTSTMPPKQVLMEFHMPDAAPLIESCGEDRAIRGIKP